MLPNDALQREVSLRSVRRDDPAGPEAAKISQESLGSLLDWAVHELSELGHGEARASAELLLGESLHCRRHELYLDAGKLMAAAGAARFKGLVKLRKARCPTAYLTKSSAFWKGEFFVDERCLVPRPESEVLVEIILRSLKLPESAGINVLDMCCGSGNLGISLLCEWPAGNGTFADVSGPALDVTRKNLERHRLLERSRVVCSDLFEMFRRAPEKWEVIICNPPYLSHADLLNAEPEVLREPLMALDGGIDGLDFYRRGCREAGDRARPGGERAL